MTSTRSYPKTCPCGREFLGWKPTAIYCSDACRIRIGKYGRMTYGQQGRPRVLGVAK